MQTAEPASTQEDTERMVQILYSTYRKAHIKQVANNTTQMNAEERILLLSIIEDFENLFDGTLGHWDTEPVNLELKTAYKPFISRYDLVPRINKYFFAKSLNY